MTIRSMLTSISAASVVAAGLFACASSTNAPADEAVESDNEALVTCATVRCASGTHCVAKHHRASCVPNTKACPTASFLCILGYHYDNTPGVCKCVPDATP